MLANLHRAGFNVFAIDYRGFGASDNSVHPAQPAWPRTPPPHSTT